jgi:hypothetical protein
MLYALKSWTDHKYASTPIHNYLNSSINGFDIIFSRGPGMMRQWNMNSYFIQRDGGRLYNKAKTGQQEYGAEFVLNGSKPSVVNPK